ncbi:MAG: CHAT domain-containing protein, partial [Acidobacteria bacterium]|nr:CHAT domain-containing protein [Acidobacteriota bacterium]
AKTRFREAIELVENDGRFLQSEKLRLAFDDERRELYDSAISFEYDHGSREDSWTYLQKYRAKLFLDFLAQFDPEIERVRGRALDRSVVQKLVGKDLEIIEYVLLKDRLLIWVMSDTQFTSRSVPITRDALETKVFQILTKLRAAEPVDSLSEELGKLLIDPVADLLSGNRTLAIIPDRALHGLPFGAVRRPGKPGYLIEQYPIIVSPSLTHLLATPGTRPNRNSIVTIGSQSDDAAGTRELSALQKIYSTVIPHRGRTVDKPTFLAAMDDAPIFHYAGHSATDAIDPLRSSILLDGNRYGPNSVTAVDIAQQRLPNNAVVVLSSCDSSVGNSKDGVGMRGLTSAFLIGGAGSVVGSLWPVEASSTSELMIRFHKSFATSKMPVAHALREAQLTFLKSFPERSHPYYWSGFVVTGNLSALR